MKQGPSSLSTLKRLLEKIQSYEILANPWWVAIILLVVTLVCYGIPFRDMGFFWDAWPMNWIAQTRGNAGLAEYFSTNRPVWGLLYQITTPILGGQSTPWQIFALVLRGVVAFEVWGLFRLLWPRQTEPALWAGLIFVVYPGFQQQSIGLLYAHFYLVIGAFVGSLICSLAAWRQPRRRILLVGVGMLLSLANLLMMEYFFLLELLRPVILWLAAWPEVAERKARLKKVFLAWVPYLIVFIGAAIWRVFLFPYTTNNYQMTTLADLTARPLDTLAELLKRIGQEVWITTGQAWVRAANLLQPDPTATINTSRLIQITVAMGLGLFVTGLLLASRRAASRKENLQWSFQSILLGGIALLLAGGPFWLTNVPFSLDFAFDRFTLPFLFGVCWLWCGVVTLIPWRPARWLILACLIGLGTSYQFQVRQNFYQDWVSQQQFFWQLQWRAPALKPGTTIIANETDATAFSTDNSLSAPLNWIYDPDNHSQAIRYQLVYPSIRINGKSAFQIQPDTPYSKDFLVGTFEGNTSQSITIFYDGINCLRVVDPAIDSGNPIIPDDLKTTAGFGNLALIQPLPAGQTAQPPLPAILGQPPKTSWCQVFEKADLLRQYSQWYNILDIWKEGKALESQSKFAAERIPFVEAFARTGQWKEAANLTINTQKSRASFCRLWQTLDQTGPDAADKKVAVSTAMDVLKCAEYGIFPQ
jgi:hypothetical protein